MSEYCRSAPGEEQTYTGAVADWNLPDGTGVECVHAETSNFKLGTHYTIKSGILGHCGIVRSEFKSVKKDKIFAGKVSDWNLPDGTVVECTFADTDNESFTVGAQYTIGKTHRLCGQYYSNSEFMLSDQQSSPDSNKQGEERTYTGPVCSWNLPDGTVVECVHAGSKHFTLGNHYTVEGNSLDGTYTECSRFKVVKREQPSPEQTYTGPVAEWNLPDGTLVECTNPSSSRHFKLGTHYRITSGHLGHCSIVRSEFKVIEEQIPPKNKPERAVYKTKGENSGGSCDYYRVAIKNPTTEEQQPYTAECNDVIEALDMKYAEANIFKEIWRSAAARTLGKQKAGHDVIRGAEKIVFFANRNAINKGVK